MFLVVAHFYTFMRVQGIILHL